MITISVCLIVKNEEAILARGLDSLAGVYDELIIVDTGSTDRTKEIAYRYTDLVYDFTWVNDFSAARNYMFSKATKEYIYVADADEVLEPEEREKLLQLKQVLLPEIEIVQMRYANQLEHNTTYNYDMEYRPMLYKRLRTFTWRDPIHESVVLDPVIYNSDIIVTHRPTSNHGKRDFGIFQRAIARDGKLSSKLRMMYARELYIAGEEADFLEAYEYFSSQVEEVSTEEELRQIYPILMRCARIKQDTMAMLMYSSKVFAGGISSSEVCCELGEFYYRNGLYQEAILWFYNAAFECHSELYIQYQKEIPLARIADCNALLGNVEDENYYRGLLGE